ncbi:MAG: glycosyltransferase family 39 protein [Candidatus Alcyoniella australis]|nr:glycosyltransferase family 39 protein [Candidatus Alcyoniella australis]
MTALRRLIAAFEALLLIVLILVGVGMRFDIAGKSIDFDAGLFAYSAQRVANDPTGATSYTDYFDNMPPLIYSIYRASFALLGQNARAIHMTSLLPDLLIILLIVLLGHAWVSWRSGLWAAAFYALSYVPLRMSHFGQAENAAMAAVLIGLLVYTRALTKDPERRLWWLMLAGACIGVGSMIKQPAVFFLVAIAAHLTLIHLRNVRMLSRAALHFGWVLAGFGGFLLLIGLALTWRGILVEAVNACFWFPIHNQGIYGMSGEVKWREFLEKAVSLLPFWGVLGAAGLLRAAIKRESGLLLAALSLLFVILFWLWTGDFFQHYTLYALPIVALLAGSAVDYALTAKRGWWMRLLVALALVGMISYQYGIIRRARYGYGELYDERTGILNYYYNHDNSLQYQLEIARCLENQLEPHDLLLSTTPTYNFLIDRENHYSQYYIAPLTRTASSNFRDMDRYLDQSKIAVVELSRKGQLPEHIGDRLDQSWDHVRCITARGSPDSVLVYRNPNPRKIAR